MAGACVIALAPMTVDAEGSGAGNLPPGHPPVETYRLPPGHPPVQGGETDATCTPGLPDGHPAVQDPRLPPGHPPVQLKPCTPDATSNGVYHPDVFSTDVKVIET